MSAPHRILISLRGHGKRGPRYAVHLNSADGPLLLEGTSQPMLDAARCLLAQNITGPIEMWDNTRGFPRLKGDIEKLARLTVSETQAGINLRRYVERAAGGDLEDEPSSGAENESGRPGCVLRQEAA